MKALSSDNNVSGQHATVTQVIYISPFAGSKSSQVPSGTDAGRTRDNDDGKLAMFLQKDPQVTISIVPTKAQSQGSASSRSGSVRSNHSAPSTYGSTTRTTQGTSAPRSIKQLLHLAVPERQVLDNERRAARQSIVYQTRGVDMRRVKRSLEQSLNDAPVDEEILATSSVGSKVACNHGM